jgi:nitroreductase
MTLFEAVQKRYSYRGAYQPLPVPREDLRKILEAGLAAPSGCNTQTTSLIALDDPALVKKLGGLLGKSGFATAPAALCVLPNI